MSGTRCQTNPVFILTEYQLPTVLFGFIKLATSTLSKFLPIQVVSQRTVILYPVQFHSLVLAAFASLIAPFGGFFASGVKRAFKLKDFSDSIPGHGGLTDRFDCQFIMGVFSYMYFTTFLQMRSTNVGAMLQTITKMQPELALEIYTKLGEYLSGQGLI
jgi:phosphatidate cytidylyltransferase